MKEVEEKNQVNFDSEIDVPTGQQKWLLALGRHLH